MAFQGAKVVNLFIMAKCLTLYFSCFIDSFFIAPRAGQPLPALRATICKKLVDNCFIDSFFYCIPRGAIFACPSRDYLQKNSSIKNCNAIFYST